MLESVKLDVKLLIPENINVKYFEIKMKTILNEFIVITIAKNIFLRIIFYCSILNKKNKMVINHEQM